MSERTKQHFSLTRVGDPVMGVHLHSHGSTLYFDTDSWNELCNMIRDFNSCDVPRMMNYTEEERHGGTPSLTSTRRPPTIEDLA